MLPVVFQALPFLVHIHSQIAYLQLQSGRPASLKGAYLTALEVSLVGGYMNTCRHCGPMPTGQHAPRKAMNIKSQWQKVEHCGITRRG